MTDAEAMVVRMLTELEHSAGRLEHAPFWSMVASASLLLTTLLGVIMLLLEGRLR